MQSVEVAPRLTVKSTSLNNCKDSTHYGGKGYDEGHDKGNATVSNPTKSEHLSDRLVRLLESGHGDIRSASFTCLVVDSRGQPTNSA